MIILVSDTSVLIDLERGGLLEAAFLCGFTMIVPDLLYQNELEDYNGPYLRGLGLGVVALTPAEVSLAQRLKADHRPLSLDDCFALSCATRPDHVLLTGDQVLRDVSQDEGVRVHGVLWLMDQMEASGRVPHAELHRGLTQLIADKRCRLPAEQARTRLERWQVA